TGLIIGALIVIILGLAVALMMRPPAEPTAVTTASVEQPPPQPATSTASMEVLSAPITTTSTTAEPAPVVTTTTREPERVAPTPARTQTAAPEREPEPERVEPVPAPVPASTVAAYTENGDSDRNEALLASFRSAVSGVSRIALRGPNAIPLGLALREEAPSLTVDPSADVVVHFEANVERLGRAGRKRRSATAVVTKNGRVIFRYEMPPEDYRVGDTPAEAFAKVLSDAFSD
ncbi:MAG TPA: hypothetical protein VF698_03155, partial [Thermoanaerobaculia bacterium]